MLKFTDAPPQLPIVAHIRKGTEKQMNARGNLIMGRELDTHFRAEFSPASTPADFQLFKKFFNGEDYQAKVYVKNRMETRTDQLCRSIRFYFPFSELAQVWDSNIEIYSKSQLHGKANQSFWEFLRKDGKVLVRDFKVVYPHEDEQGNQYKNGDRRIFDEYEILWRKPDGEPILGKVKAKIFIMIPGFGVRHFVVHTTSWNDVYRVNAHLLTVKKILEIAGQPLAGAPLVISREPVEISKRNENGERFRGISHLLTIRLSPEWEQEFLPQIAPSAYAHLLAAPAPVVVEELDESDLGQPIETPEPFGKEQNVKQDEAEFVIPEWVKLQKGTIVEDEARLFYAVARQMAGMSGVEAGKLIQKFENVGDAIEHLKVKVLGVIA